MTHRKRKKIVAYVLLSYIIATLRVVERNTRETYTPTSFILASGRLWNYCDIIEIIIDCFKFYSKGGINLDSNKN